MPYVAAGCLVAIWCLLMPLKFRFARQGRRKLSILFKTLSTLLCAGLAACAAFSSGADDTSRLLLIGLLVCAAADAMLEIRFEVGGALFFFGHVIYVLAFLRLRAITLWSLPIFVLLVAGLLWFLLRRRSLIDAVDKRLFYGLLLYALAISAMVSVAVPTPFLAFSPRMLSAAVGAVLFLASDITLCQNSLLHRPERSEFISLGLYYTGQLLIAFTAVA